MRSSFRKAGYAQTILQHTLRLECGKNVAEIRHTFSTLGVSKRCRKGVEKQVQVSKKGLLEHYPTDYHVAKGNYSRPCDTLSTPFRHPPKSATFVV